MIEDIFKTFADVGGISRLLLIVICYMVHKNNQTTSSLLQSMRQNDKRFVDFKKNLYLSGQLPNRRKNRNLIAGTQIRRDDDLT